METEQQTQGHEMPVAKNVSQSSTLDDQLAFLNSLPVAQKPKPAPKHNDLDDHVAFLGRLSQILDQDEKPEPATVSDVNEVSSSADSVAEISLPDAEHDPAPVVKQKNTPQPTILAPKKKTVRPAQKNRSASQIQREEKNRLQKEKADAKKAEIRKRQQEAGQSQASAPAKAPVQKAKSASKMASFLGRFKKD